MWPVETIFPEMKDNSRKSEVKLWLTTPQGGPRKPLNSEGELGIVGYWHASSLCSLSLLPGAARTNHNDPVA